MQLQNICQKEWCELRKPRSKNLVAISQITLKVGKGGLANFFKNVFTWSLCGLIGENAFLKLRFILPT